MKIILHPNQSKVFHHLFKPIDRNNPDEWMLRFVSLRAARGFGKSYLSGTTILGAVSELESMDLSVPNKNIAVLCGSHSQVVDIYFPLLAYQLGLESRSVKVSRRDGLFVLPNNTRVKCWSSDAYDRLRGSGQYLVVCDEITTWRVPGGSVQDAYESVIEPTVLTRWNPERAKQLNAPSPGRILVPSTPMGKDYFYDLSMKEREDRRWKSFHYTFMDTPNLPMEDILEAKRHMDPIRFAREYEASFEDSGANVFYTFNYEEHVKKDLPYFTEDETVHCAIDFNIMKQCTSFHAIRGNQLHCLDEHQGSANTEELAKLIREKFPKNKIICYPDPSGARRVTSAPIGQTDFSILREAGFTVLSRKKQPPIVDSVAAVNRKLMNANKEIDFFISNQCKGVINSLERTSWIENKSDSATIDKTMDIEHFSDGLRYLVEYLWPIRFERPVVVNSNFF